MSKIDPELASALRNAIELLWEFREGALIDKARSPLLEKIAKHEKRIAALEVALHKREAAGTIELGRWLSDDELADTPKHGRTY